MNNSFLKWAGSKQNALNNIFENVPQSGEVLIEPFMGACNVSLNADYKKMILCDINEDLVNLCRWVAKKPKDVIREAQSLFTKETNQLEKYYELRKKYNESVNPKERALLFLYLNRHAYNGLCRYNNSGGYNVSFGFYKKPLLPVEAIHFFSKKLKTAEFKHIAFNKLRFKSKEGVTVYCDPPYLPLSPTASFSAYSKLGFSPEDNDKLNERCVTWADRGCDVFLSNHQTPLIEKHYAEGTVIDRFNVRRSISCKGEKRESAPEILISYKNR